MKREVRNSLDDVVLTGIWIASSVSDLQEYKVHNKIIIVGWLTGLTFQYMMGGISSVLWGSFYIVVTIVAFWPLFSIRALGAGDVKLFSVLAGFYGLVFLAQTLTLLVLLAGGVSLIRILHRRMFRNRFRYLIHYVLYGRKTSYYLAERDGREMVIPLAPLLAIAYYLMRIFQACQG